MPRPGGFASFWAAETVSLFGTAVTTIALQVLVVSTLDGTATDVGLLNAARWLPYLVLGLVVGALVERRARKPLLVVTDAGRAVLLLLVPGLWVADLLSLPALLVVVAGVGVLSLVNDSASQSFLPRLVPRRDLVVANVRLDQSTTAAQTTGPAVGGVVVGVLSAPVAVLLDALSYAASAVLVGRIRVDEPRPAPLAGRSLRREVVAGLRYTYRHPTLRPHAVWGHAWFLANSVATTAFVVYALTRLGLTPARFGVVLAVAGVGGLAGSVLAGPLGRRWGAGNAVVAGHVLAPVGWAVVALPAVLPDLGAGAVLAVLALGQGLYGLGLGLENSNEMAWRQAVVPDRLMGRVNTTIRSVNRAAIVVGAPLGGLLADRFGDLAALGTAVAAFTVVAAGLALSPFRQVTHRP